MRPQSSPVRAYITLVLSVPVLCPAAASAGPNLMAIGDYSAIPARRAIGRYSLSGNKIVYSFDNPEFDFGRIVVEPVQPKSVVRRDLFVGFDGTGLVIGARGGGGRAQVRNVEIWLRIHGTVRPSRRYAWEADIDSPVNVLDTGLNAVMPVFWADGHQFGAEVLIRQPDPPEDDRIQRMLIPNGEINVGFFHRVSGGAWIVLRPADYGAYIAIRRFSFREIETKEDVDAGKGMPAPVAFVPIRDVLEERLPRVLLDGARTLKEARGEGPYWSAGDVEENVRLTAQIVSALAELDPESDALLEAMQWLADQAPQDDDLWSTETVAQRLYCLARHDRSREFKRVMHADVQFLVNTQYEDGGWSERSGTEQDSRSSVVQSDNDHSAMVISSLREARFAGVEMGARVWRRALQYWTNAQAYDGGYRQKRERFGGLGQATTSAYTAYGAAGLLTSLDMAAGVGGRRCSAYRRSRKQLRAITHALSWLDVNYGEPFRNLGSLVTAPDAYAEPTALQLLGEVSGVAKINDKDQFAESARELLKHYDSQSATFGVRGPDQSWSEAPSLARTATALAVLGRGAAPTVCQRIIVGDDKEGWSQYSGDVAHLVRHLSDQQKRPLNWRRASIDQDVSEWAKVPILILSVVGPFEWSKDQWNKIREYCFAGGSVVIVLGKDQEAEREPVVSALKATFPEYDLAALPPDCPIFTSETRLSSPRPVRALSNGARYFLFIPDEPWSCHWQLYDIDNHLNSFAFMNNLLLYATDGAPLHTSFARSTYARGSTPTHRMQAARLEVGCDVPAYPNLIATMDRLTRQNYRLAVIEVDDPLKADLLWVLITGDAAESKAITSQIESAIKNEISLFVDVVGGREDWDENFRAILKGIDGIRLAKLRRNDPIYTGEIPGTQGFDVTNANLRRVLHSHFSKAGRCDLYEILFNGKRVGTYSAFDISSGIGYNLYPGCRGVMPVHARQLAMNAFLAAYERKERGEPAD